MSNIAGTGGPVWDERLLSRERALELVGRWRFVLILYEGEGEHAIHLHCAEPPHSGERKGCFQSMARIPPGYRTNLEDLLAGLLRHAVMAHDLDPGRRGDGRGQPEGAHLGSGGGGARRPRALGDRPDDQAGADPDGDRFPGGDAA